MRRIAMKVNVYLFDGGVLEFDNVLEIILETDEIFKFSYIDRDSENERRAVISLMNIAGYDIEYLIKGGSRGYEFR